MQLILGLVVFAALTAFLMRLSVKATAIVLAVCLVLWFLAPGAMFGPGFGHFAHFGPMHGPGFGHGFGFGLGLHGLPLFILAAAVIGALVWFAARKDKDAKAGELQAHKSEEKPSQPS